MTEPARIIADYVRRLRWSLQAIPAEDRAGIVREIESHLDDSLLAGREHLDASLIALGAPHTLAARYVQDYALAGALGADRPAPLIRAMLMRSGRSVAAFGAVATATTLYLFALCLAAVAIGKLIVPAHAGLWTTTRGTSFGLLANPPATPDLIGLWIVPLALVGALSCYAVATLALRGAGQHLIRRAAPVRAMA